MITSQNSSDLKLSDYGKDFQNKLLYLTLTDKNFFENIYDILDEELYETSALQWITKRIKEYYKEYHLLPDISAFKGFIKKDTLLTDINKLGIRDSLMAAFKFENDEHLEFVKDEAKIFFKNKYFELVLFEAADLLRDNKFEEIKALVDQAASTGLDRNIGHNYKTDLRERYGENARNCIATGFDPIDLYLDGGLGLQELGVILAMSSAGKTWVLCHLAANALKQGKKVIFYTLEDSEYFISKRIDSIMMKKSTSELHYHVDEIEKVLKKYEANIIVKAYPQNVTTTATLTGHLNGLRMAGWTKNEGEIEENDLLVIADYGDIFAPMKNFQSDWLNQKQIYNELKSWAQVMNIRLWTAAQSNLGGEGQDVIESTKMGGAYAKVAPCNIIISLSRTIEDKKVNTARLHLAKNKYGPDSITFPVHNDNNSGEFRVYDANTVQGKEIAKKMKTGDAEVKKRVGDKYKHMLERKRDS